MIYVIVALKNEAQAFVDKFKLNTSKCNDKISLIISGIGSENMFNTTKNIIKKMNSNDTLVNVGICGASKKYEIGQLLDASSASLRKDINLTCVDYEVSHNNYEVVDMESKGFIEASKDVKNKYIFKIVSDHFEPSSVTKNMAKKLIFDKIDEIMEKIS
ncbi:MAG: hypothetical protein OQJ77_05780 [Thiovulaceae bacterium]|nr:hypothetical protein [Sulfurimonadaceae bacterium]